MLIIGSHVSFGKSQLLGATQEAISYGSNTFMFYTGAPTNTVRKDIETKYTQEAIKLMEDNDIDINNVVCHAPYIVNLGNASDPDKYNFSKEFIKKELQRCDEMGITKMVLHPGNATNGLTKEEGLNNIVNALAEFSISSVHLTEFKTSSCAVECDSHSFIGRMSGERITHNRTLLVKHINANGIFDIDFFREDTSVSEISVGIFAFKIELIHRRLINIKIIFTGCFMFTGQASFRTFFTGRTVESSCAECIDRNGIIFKKPVDQIKMMGGFMNKE